MGDIQTTIDLLQSGDNPLVRKPKLTDKLLGKPPFRFLHDVISEVQRNTGFAPGLYGEDELNAENVKDKDSKVAYLQKIISCVSYALGKEVPANPLKIVAGLEAENTNLFLQMLGQAAREGPGEAAVQAVLGGGKAPLERKASKREAPPPAAQAPESEPAAPAQAAPPARQSSRTGGMEAPPAPAPVAAPPPMMPPPGMPAPSAGGMARPQSAKKAPPKAPKQELGAMGMALGEAPKAAPVVFKEGANDDDDVELEVVQEEVGRGRRAAGPVDASKAGALVKDLLNAERQLAGEEEAGGASGEQAGVGGGIKLGGRRKAGRVGGEGKDDTSAIREGIQVLCQSTNPLGRYLELLAEDSDSMAKELAFWREERRASEQKLEELAKQEGPAAESKSAVLIKKLDEEIHSMRVNLQAIKSQILANDDQLGRLLSTITK